MLQFSLDEIQYATDLGDQKGVYAWFLRLTAYNYTQIKYLLGASAYNRVIRGNDEFNNRPVKVQINLDQALDETRLNPDELNSRDLNYFAQVSNHLTPPVYIGYSKNLLDRLSKHATFIRRGIVDYDSPEDDTSHFVQRIADINERLQSLGLRPLRTDDFYVKVGVACEQTELKTINEFERTLIDSIGPIGNKQII